MTKILYIVDHPEHANEVVKTLESLKVNFKKCQPHHLASLKQELDTLQPHLLIIDGAEVALSLLPPISEFIPETHPPVLVLLSPSSPAIGLHKYLQSGRVDCIFRPYEETLIAARIRSLARMRSLYLDITNQKKQLEDLYSEQNYLMSIVAHDLKSPLNKVLGFIQFLPLVGDLNAEQSNYVNMVHKVVEEGRKLIDDILTINAYESHLAQLQVEKIGLPAFIQDLINTYAQAYQQKKIALRVNIPKKLYLLSEKESLSRILDNLLSNALKFSDPGTEVLVTAKPLGKTGVEIAVADQGPGISSQDRLKMFKKFQKLSAQPTAGENSTGLGLSIIKALVGKLSGEVLVDSTLGEGTTFYIRLPHLSGGA